MSIGFNEIQLIQSEAEDIVKLVLKGKVDKRDYDMFVPQLEWLIEKGGHIRLLLKLIDFECWTPGALWEDAKFTFKHFTDIEKIAVTSEGDIRSKGIVPAIKLFSRKRVRYFTSGEEQAALTWLQNE